MQGLTLLNIKMHSTFEVNVKKKEIAVHLLMFFLAFPHQYSTQKTFQATCSFSTNCQPSKFYENVRTNIGPFWVSNSHPYPTDLIFLNRGFQVVCCRIVEFFLCRQKTMYVSQFFLQIF